MNTTKQLQELWGEGVVEFSLACVNCDCDSPDSHADAVASGWSEIEYDDGPGWNYLGMCSGCQTEEKR